jgi:hypothetical protein
MSGAPQIVVPPVEVDAASSARLADALVPGFLLRLLDIGHLRHLLDGAER